MPVAVRQNGRGLGVGLKIGVSPSAVPFLGGKPDTSIESSSRGQGPLQQTPARASMERRTAPFSAFTNSAIPRSLLYTPEQRHRRDLSVWTTVQGVLAPLQFAVFLISLGFVLHYLATGQGLSLATGSVVVKTAALYAIMITGSIWEREVFGCYLFARAFFWEDVFSMVVLALHTGYVVALITEALQPQALMLLALAAYATYIVNAAQFLLKLRAARLDERASAFVCRETS